MDTTMNATTASVCPHNSTAHDGTLLCHWADSTGARGTLNIFWLCISTLGLCVWNAVHPDVPRPEMPGSQIFTEQVRWLFVGLFMPEMLVLVALNQLREALKLLADVDNEGLATQFPWWMYLFKAWNPKHQNPVYEARWYMRVVLWCFPPAPDRSVVTSDNGREHCWTLTHSFYAVMGGFRNFNGAVIGINGRDIRVARPSHASDHIPDLSIEDIEDRGKAGVLAKSLLVWQLFVFLVNCFVRWDQSLPLSLLEITTIGHSLCSIIAMVLWWYKPHSIGEATVTNRQARYSGLSDEERIKVFSCDFLFGSYIAGMRKVLTDNRMDVPQTVAIAAVAVLYGLPHLFGLSVHFPTFAEQLCWTIATIMVIGLPLVMCAIVWTPLPGRSGLRTRVLSLIILVFLLYPMASMFLVGESVRQIFALPVESFREPQQTTYLPSFS